MRTLEGIRYLGSVVLTWRLLMVGTYLLKSIGYGGLWIVRKAFRT